MLHITIPELMIQDEPLGLVDGPMDGPASDINNILPPLSNFVSEILQIC